MLRRVLDNTHIIFSPYNDCGPFIESPTNKYATLKKLCGKKMIESIYLLYLNTVVTLLHDPYSCLVCSIV